MCYCIINICQKSKPEPPKPETPPAPVSFSDPIIQSPSDLNRDFSSNQISETGNKMEEKIEPNATFVKYYRDRSGGFKTEEFNKHWNASMNGFLELLEMFQCIA